MGLVYERRICGIGGVTSLLVCLEGPETTLLDVPAAGGTDVDGIVMDGDILP